MSEKHPNLKGGSRKGIPNKATAAIKDMILGALSDVGGQDYLSRQAEENPVAFMGLIGKVLPTQITGGDGPNDKPLTLKVEYVRPATGKTGVPD